MDYDFRNIEARWQRYWEENKTFKAEDDFSKPKFYALDMFPYPSGAGLHVGHPEGYTATDIMCRYKRMKGFNVLHPMGWDAFGLPAEQYAIKTKSHPQKTTEVNINRFREQLKSLGFAYDWDREVNTSDPKYYKWTQWIFLQLLKKDLAYVAEVPVNWCPGLGTVLANEEVIDGFSERDHHPVIRKPMKQWILKITAYAERLLDDLDELDWPHSLKEMQRNWIGRSIGAEVDFAVKDQNAKLRVFTTRPDTLFGASYMVVAPEHQLVASLTTEAQQADVAAYVKQAGFKSDLERTDLAKSKTGVFSGSYAINPVNNQAIPIWIADYVLVSYGTGAIMAVPGHDERDYEFAKTFDLPIIEVIGNEESNLAEEAWTGEGRLVNSEFLTGLEVSEAKTKIIDWLAERGLGVKAINYKLRDWLFSRQRYWGEPFPVVHTKSGEIRPLPEEMLPIRLPEVEAYQPTGTGESPLAGIDEWVNTTDPESGEEVLRETNTMPGWAGSCWYYLRYLDPHNDSAMVDPKKENYWMPVDLYVGGVEHAVLHLLYARFWHKVLYDVGAVSTKEPFQKLVNQGMILGYTYRYFEDLTTNEILKSSQVKTTKDGLLRIDNGAKVKEQTVHMDDVVWKDEKPTFTTAAGIEIKLEQITEKMSKSRGNVVNPDKVVNEFGADSLRLYEMFMGPLEQVKPWNPKGVTGVHRFLQRFWRLVVGEDGNLNANIVDSQPSDEEKRALHKCIKKVSNDTVEMRFNTAIASMMETLNWFYKAKTVSRSSIERLCQLLSPYAPHICEELWQKLGHNETIAVSNWPDFDEALTVDATIKMAVQINGKVRGTIELAKDCPEDEAVATAKANTKVAGHLEGKSIFKTIYRPGRILNFVVKG